MIYLQEALRCMLSLCASFTESTKRLYLLLTRNGTQYKQLENAMCKLVYQAIGKYIHPTRYRQIVETESVKKLCLEDPKNISLDQKHSSQVARIYYQKNSLRRVAVDGEISMRKLLGGSRDTSDSLIKSMLFSEKSESDISKASLEEIKKGYRTDEEEDDVESFVPCAQASPQNKVKINHEETKARELSDDTNSTASNTLKEFKNSERRTRVLFTPEEDSFIRKGIKKHGRWTEILRSFKDNFRSRRTVDSIKKRLEKLFGEEK